MLAWFMRILRIKISFRGEFRIVWGDFSEPRPKRLRRAE